jgi:enoyl-CoA hydratase
VSDGPIAYEVRGNAALLAFDDGKANVVSFESLAAINAGLDRAEKDAKVVVLAGRKGRFSAGFDLATLGQGPPQSKELVRGGAELLARLYGFPLPVCLACTGHALGMGGLLLLAADIRFGADGDYKIGLNEVAIGMTMPEFGVVLASDRLSKRHLTRSLVLAEIYSPADGVDAGFLDRVMPAESLLGETLAHAEQLSTLHTRSHTGTKRALRQSAIDRLLASLAVFD